MKGVCINIAQTGPNSFITLFRTFSEKKKVLWTTHAIQKHLIYEKRG